MQLNLANPIVFFDLETTGVNISKDRIIEISLLKVAPNGKEEGKTRRINPGIPIPPEATAIHGISDEDVKDCPTFKEIAKSLAAQIEGCDLAGFNSNRFDIPLLAEEFLRADVDIDLSKRKFVDVQTIFHKMEKRNLAAAYKFYCGRKMEEDFAAHRADQDAEATYRVLLGELEKYSEANQEEAERVLPNDMDYLAEFSKNNDNVDFAGRIVWRPVLDANGKETLDDKGQVIKKEYFNFGKYKGCAVDEVLQRDPGYYSWMIQADFTNNTKQVLTRIRLKGFGGR